MATTMLPFLYHTRTLQRLSRPAAALRRHVLPGLLRPAPARRFFGSSPVLAKRTKRKTQDDHDIPFELPRDLAADPRFNPTAEAKEAANYGTITPQERRAFDSIFRELESGAIRAHRGPAASLDIFKQADSARDQEIVSRIIADAVGEDWNEPDPNLPSKSVIQSMRSLHNIDSAGQAAGSPLSPSARYEALLRFPPSLRDAAKRALGISDAATAPEGDDVVEAEEAADTLPDAPPPITLKPLGLDRAVQSHFLDRARDKERTRVEELMEAAKTDFELWDVLEREVFSVISRLCRSPSDLAAAGAPLGTQKSRRGRKPKTADATGVAPEPKKEDAAEVVQETNPFTVSTGAAEPDMHIHGYLYPSHLVYALQLMDSRFCGSRLALEILPRVKSLGLESFVLGVSTQFYTQLMTLMWTRYNDGHAALNLVEEMMHAGLETSYLVHGNLISDIGLQIEKAGSGRAGELAQKISSHPLWTSLIGTRIPHIHKTVQVEQMKMSSKRDIKLYAS